MWNESLTKLAEFLLPYNSTSVFLTKFELLGVTINKLPFHFPFVQTLIVLDCLGIFG